MGYLKHKRPVQAPSYETDDGSAIGGAVSVNWWDHPKAYIMSRSHLSFGDIVNSFGRPIVLINLSSDASGNTGLGGIVDISRACNAVGDTSPAINQYRGYYVGGETVRADIGHYFRLQARYAVAAHQDLWMGLVDQIWGAVSVADMCGFEKLEADVNWFMKTSDGTTVRRVDTGIAWNAADWHNFEVYLFDAGGGVMTAMFWIDGVLVGTSTTNVPRATEIEMEPHMGSLWKNADLTTNDAVMFVSSFVWAIENDLDLQNEYATLDLE